MTDRVATASERVGGVADALREAVDAALGEVRDTVDALQSRVLELESERDELAEQVKSLEEIENEELDDAYETLTEVRYWFHNFMGNRPHPVLRKVERCLEDMG